MNQLLKKHPKKIDSILRKYPPEQKRAAIMPLLHLVQQDAGFVSRDSMREVAEITGVSVTEVLSVVGFYTLFHENPGGKIRLQVCTDVACDLRGASDYLKQLCDALGIQPGETSADGMVTIEEVKCLAACDRAPMFQMQGKGEIQYHEKQTLETARLIIEEIRRQVWFRFTGKAGDRIWFQVGVPVIERLRGLEPRAAIVGPGLPAADLGFELPPGLGAVVFAPAGVPREFHEEFTGTSSWIWLEQEFVLASSGTWYVVAFSDAALSTDDKLWLAIGTKERFGLGDILRLGSIKRFVRAFHEVR